MLNDQIKEVAANITFDTVREEVKRFAVWMEAYIRHHDDHPLNGIVCGGSLRDEAVQSLGQKLFIAKLLMATKPEVDWASVVWTEAADTAVKAMYLSDVMTTETLDSKDKASR